MNMKPAIIFAAAMAVPCITATAQNTNVQQRTGVTSVEPEPAKARSAARHVLGVLAPRDLAIEAQALRAVRQAARVLVRQPGEQMQGARQWRIRKARTSSST